MITRFNDLSKTIQYLKNQVSLSEAIGKVVEVKKTSATMHKCLCPFHGEKTPSFTITPDKKVYYCFGCHKGGDLVTFYREFHTLSTVEAIEAIALDYQLDLEQFKRPLTPEEIEHNRLININNLVAEGLHSLTLDTNFWTDRGIDPDSEKLVPFKLGYCPDLTTVVRFATQAGATPQDLEVLDLTRVSMWTDSVVYPVIDSSKRVLGFKNRPLYGGNRQSSQPKFIGSVQTKLMDTSVPYGFHEARKHLKRGKPLIVVEGQHDVLSMVADGTPNVVCSDGTSINIEKLNYLQEHGVSNMVLAFDGDRAGQDSANTLVQLANEHKDELDLIIKIATIEIDEDPDSLIRQGKRLSLMLAIDGAVFANQFLIDNIVREIELSGDLKSATGKIDFLNRVKPILSISKNVERSILIDYSSQKIGLSNSGFIEDMLREEAHSGQKSVLFNIDGEKIVLAQMIRNEDYLLDVLTILKSKHMYVTKHQHLFDIMSSINRSSQNVTLETIRTEINNKGMRDIFADGFVESLQNITGNAVAMLDDVLEKAIRREMQGALNNALQQVTDLSISTPLLAESMMTTVQDTMENQSESDMLKPQDGATGVMDRVFNKMNNPNEVMGIPIRSFPMLTNILHGLNENRLIVISANQSVGKTTMVSNWISDIALDDGLPWLHFSLEMGKEEMADKIVAINANVEGNKINTGTLTNDEYARMQTSAMKYYNSKLFIDDESVTVESIINKIRKYQRVHNIAGVSIDYIQLMTVERSKANQRYEELGDISGALKRDVAKKMKLPVIILSQLNKGAVDKEVAKAEDGAGAYKIAQDADIYITLKEKSDKEVEEQGGLQAGGNITTFLDKHRQGKADVFIDTLFTRENQRMVEISK